jgi:hypothetical protein
MDSNTQHQLSSLIIGQIRINDPPRIDGPQK